MKKLSPLLLLSLMLSISVQRANANVVNVMMLNDNIVGSLRDAITTASSGDTINFVLTGTFPITSRIVWNKTLTIIGAGTGSIILDGGDSTGIFEIDGGRNLIKGITFIHANAADGACILAPSGSQTDSVLIINCDFRNSQASDASAGVEASNGRYLFMQNCNIDSCICTQNLSGGVQIFNGLIENCTFTNCTALYEAGALWTFGFASTIQNCTFYNNSAQIGGAIYDEINSGDLTLINNTFSNNSASSGGSNVYSQSMPGPFGGETITFENNIFNGPGSNFGSQGTFTGTSLGGNISSDATMSSFLTGTNDQNNVNPLLAGAPANNGGFTKTIALQCSSPAVNNGVTGGSPLTDQRGNSRVGAVDAGSYELQSQSATISHNITLCPGNSLTVGDSIYTAAGVYTNTFSSGACGDTTLITNLGFYAVSTVSQTVAICHADSFKVGNHCYKTTGTFNDTLSTIHGCDSFITTHLTVRQPIFQFGGNTFCGSGSVTVGNHTYTTAGNFMDTLTSSTGCDSVIETVIQILPTDTTRQSPVICSGDSFVVGGHVYKNNGNYTDILSNLHNCDSVVYTNLTVRNALLSAQAFNVCSTDSVVVGTSVYNTSGTFTNIFTAITGCDSTVTTTVTVRQAITSSQSLTICKGEQISVGGTIHNTAGTFTDVLTAHNGCDSTVTTVLTIYQIDTAVTLTGSTLIANTSPGKTYQWFDCSTDQPVAGATSQIFNPIQTGYYGVVEIQNNCVDTSACYHVIVEGITNTTAELDLHVYPNPTNGAITVSFGKVITNGYLRVFNLFGQQLLEQSVQPVNTVMVDITSYATGIYFIEVSDNNHTNRIRIIKD